MEKNRQIVLLALGLLLLLLWPAERARADDVSELQQQIQEQTRKLREMQERVDQLEARQRLKERALAEKIEQIQEKAEKEEVGTLPDDLKWLENIKISGDFRYRHESINAESSGRWKTGRSRHRIRARLGLNAKVNDEWDLGFRIASGSADPVSTNQSLDGGFSSKDLWLDLGYFNYHPLGIKGLNVYGGKMKNPFYKVGKNQLIWDGDLNPEGIAATYKIPLGDRDTLHINGGGFWAEESSSDVDTSLWGAQTYLKHEFGNKNYLLGGLSYFDYGNIEGRPTLYSTDPDDEAFGNTFTTSGGKTYYAGDYDIFEVFGEYGFKAGDMPLAVYGDYAYNTAAATSEDTGWLIGFKINKAKTPGSWDVSYDYRDLEADAVIGLFSDSDFIGGGTNGKGHRFGFTYQLAKNLQAGATYFLNEKGDDEDDYRRLQLDLKFKF